MEPITGIGKGLAQVRNPFTVPMPVIPRHNETRMLRTLRAQARRFVFRDRCEPDYAGYTLVHTFACTTTGRICHRNSLGWVTLLSMRKAHAEECGEARGIQQRSKSKNIIKYIIAITKLARSSVPSYH